MLGKLSWSVIPLAQPLPLYAMGVVGIFILAGIIGAVAGSPAPRHVHHAPAVYKAAAKPKPKPASTSPKPKPASTSPSSTDTQPLPEIHHHHHTHVRVCVGHGLLRVCS